MAVALAEPLAPSAARASLAVRCATERDAPGLVGLINQLAVEATLLFVVPIDPVNGADDLRQFVHATAASGNNGVFVAALGDRLVGLATATGGVHPAKRATVEIGIGILEAYRARGIGRALMAGVEDWARIAGIHRLQLPVVCTNEPAIGLYRKSGFTIEGTLRQSARVNGRDVDQYMMSKLLG
ncbi:MAG TPA: GNAT family N-acetyltransferase [Stellaceae bacterium]|nr:GNAT family N-acetyltransferase [Stellaceae bacterium]